MHLVGSARSCVPCINLGVRIELNLKEKNFNILKTYDNNKKSISFSFRDECLLSVILMMLSKKLITFM